MDAYQDFAYVYDELMDNTPYEEWCDRIEDLIAKYGVSEPAERECVGTPEVCVEVPEICVEVPEICVEVPEICVEVPETCVEVPEICVEVPEVCGQISRNFAMEECEEDWQDNREDDWEDDWEEDWQEEDELAEDEQCLLDSEKNLVVDLGCGTGTLTEMLYSRGYDMIGIDNAEEMLNIAMEKRAESGARILYLLQDMRELELYSTVGTVVSVCDSVNYILEEEELLDTFSLVNNYLYPGGIFIFDFNTEYKYREIIGERTIAENREDCSFIWENYYDPESCINEYDLTVFVQEEEDIFRKFTETHYQRGYTTEQMAALVEQAGMILLEMKDADTGAEVTDQSQRVYIVARESGKTL